MSSIITIIMNCFYLLHNCFQKILNPSENVEFTFYYLVFNLFKVTIFFFYFSDLCDRVEKGIVSEHQRALSKMLNLNKQRMKGVIRGTAVSQKIY